MVNKKYMRILFILYLVILIKVIVFKYPFEQLKHIVESWSREVFWEGLHGANFEFFRTIKLYANNWDNKGINSFGNLIGNVLIFIPMGYLLPRISEACRNLFFCMVSVLLFVLSIELFQLFSNFGIFDVDDILLNCLGALIGFIFFKILKLFDKEKSLNK